MIFHLYHFPLCFLSLILLFSALSECATGVPPVCDVNALCEDDPSGTGHTCTCSAPFDGNGEFCTGKQIVLFSDGIMVEYVILSGRWL